MAAQDTQCDVSAHFASFTYGAATRCTRHATRLSATLTHVCRASLTAMIVLSRFTRSPQHAHPTRSSHTARIAQLAYSLGAALRK
eukprot:5404837-Prymnesium_polylepis.2